MALLLVAALSLGGPLARGATAPILSEFLAKNTQVITDEDGTYSDWIEISNPGTEAVDLTGWYLTDDATRLTKWQFPATNLAAGQFLLVWASDKNRRVPGAPLHTNFKLGDEGEFLGLVHTDGVTVVSQFAPKFPPQFPDVTYGLVAGEATNHFLAWPTPGASNSVSTNFVVANLAITPGSGWFSNSVSVTITTATPGVTIYYTTNGLYPAPSNGLVYAGPIVLTNTTVLRTMAVKTGFVPTVPMAASYLFLDQVLAQTGGSLTSSWAGFPARYTFCSNVLASPDWSSEARSNLLGLPTLSLAMDAADMFGTNGIYLNTGLQGALSERACSADFITADGQPGFQINCGIRIQGNTSRDPSVAKHNFRLLFKQMYGTGKLDYELYPGTLVNQYDTLVLHASSWDHWNITGTEAQMHRDQWAADTQLDMSGAGSRGRYLHLFLNGIYWGLFNLGERPDASFGARYFGGEGSDYDAFNQDELIDGTTNSWNTMLDIARAGLTNDAAYAALGSHLDIPFFAEYLLVNYYACNFDWPAGNWRAVGSVSNGIPFRFFTWDVEWSLGLAGIEVNFDVTVLTNGTPGRLYAALREHPEFLVTFGDAAQRHLFNEGSLTPARSAARYLQRSAEIHGAIVPETARWSCDYSRTNWLAEQNRLLTNWFPARTAILIDQLRNRGLYPALDAPVLNPHGGQFTNYVGVNITAGAGLIYYTTDGTDPRLAGGGLAPQALLYEGTVYLTNSVPIRARAFETNTWSALVEVDYEVLSVAATFVVTNTDDGGAGSLRQAITDANAHPGRDGIAFNLPGTPPYIISPASPLPALTEPVAIDGGTQPGYTGAPLVVLAGTAAGVANGLVVQGGDSEVRALVITGFRGSGIDLRSDSNSVAGCYLGIAWDGNTKAGNGVAGVSIVQGSHNRIGGRSAASRNLISGNHTGVYITGLFANSNTIVGNFIGPDLSGAASLGNTNNGVLLSAPGNTIGGALPTERNVISGNGQSGVYLYELGATGNRVLGNYIGTSVSGNTAVSNGVDGVTLYEARGNFIGANLISGNHERGLLLTGTNALGNLVEGNFVGTTADGFAGLGNHYTGVALIGASDNLIGGLDPSARNVISGNGQSGVAMDSNSVANLVLGNLIGTDLTGTNALPNSLNGVSILEGMNNVVGGTEPGAGNTVSGNTESGILVAGGAGNVIQGNWIGTAFNGRAACPNGFNGVRIQSAGNLVGGTGPAARNIISGNLGSGVFLSGGAATDNVVIGNHIGADVTGTNALPNQVSGVGLSDAPRNFIGSSEPGGGNLVSGNVSSGIYLTGPGATGNRILGNFIGTDAGGRGALSNLLGGIFLYGSPTNYLGGTEPGAGNVIAANHHVGISIGDPGANGNVILGNFIGLGADGLTPLGNRWHGIELLNTATGNIVGDTAPGAGNRIAYTYDIRPGVRVRDGCTGNSIRGNAIFGNDGLGIDLGLYGRTLNDPGDLDAGANNLQNFPVLATASGRYLTVLGGTLNSHPNALYTLDFYGNLTMDPTGYGEGSRFIGTAEVLTDGAGLAVFSVAFSNAVSIGTYVAGTATDAAGNTSEFSANVPAAASVDTDGDGLPDDYEIAFGLNPNSNTDRNLDLDGDGASNYEEFLAGTKANDAASVLRLRAEKLAGQTRLSFESVPGVVYRIVSAPQIIGPWTTLAENLAGTGGVLRIMDGAGEVQRFYRVQALTQP